MDGWYLDEDAIRKDWTFDDFKDALAFINKIGDLAEKHNHHPELSNVYNKVSLRFNTHSADGITAKDFSIARDIDGID
jgi:4a-hydroxytetrahydrobiopterin dehydratase